MALLFLRALIGLMDLAGIFLVGVLLSALSGNIVGVSAENARLSNILGTVDPLVLAGLAVVFFACKPILTMWASRRTLFLLASVEARLSVRIANFVFGKGLERLGPYSRGQLHWVTESSPNHATTGLLGSAASFLSEAVTVIGVFALLLIIEPRVAIFVTLLMSTFVVLYQVSISSVQRRLSEEIIRTSVASTNALADLMKGFRELKTSKRISTFLEKFETARSDSAFLSAKQSFLFSAPRQLAEVFLILAFSGSVIALLIIPESKLDFGVLGVFLVGGFRIIAAGVPMQNSFAALKNHAVQAGTAHEIIEDLPASEPQRSRRLSTRVNQNSSRAGYRLRVENLRFRYPNSSSEAIAGLSFEVEPGEMIAIVGPSGSGKTTAADLIMGLLAPEQGSVLIDEEDPDASFGPNWKSLAYVPQIPSIFSGTVAQNVALGVGDSEIDRDRVKDCLRRAKLEMLVQSFPGGTEQEIGKQFIDELSVGQKQRLAFARALYQEPRLLIVDELTSAQDPLNEANLLSELRELSPVCTVLMIAHRMQTLKSASRILVIEKGRVVESGGLGDLTISRGLLASYLDLS